MAAFCASYILLMLVIIVHAFLNPMARADEPGLPEPCAVEHDLCLSKVFSSSEDPANIDLVAELERVNAQLLDIEKNLSKKDLALQENQKKIDSLEAELETQRKDKGGDLFTALDKAQGHLKALESKVMHLENELNNRLSELVDIKDSLKVLEAAEAKHVLKVQEMEELVAEQKSFVVNAEHALHAAEATLLRVQEETDAKDRELVKAYGCWLPLWACHRVTQLQGTTANYWVKYGQPYWNVASEKASAAVSTIYKRSKPHSDVIIVNLKQTWIPVLKHWSSFITPHVDKAKKIVVGSCQNVKELYLKQVETMQLHLGPLVQVTKEATRPYFEAIAGYVRPHVEWLQSLTWPYLEKIFQSYRNFLTTAADYHSKLQVSVEGRLKKVDFLKPLASKELAWFLASALLALPLLAILLFFSLGFSTNKPVKVMKAHHHGHGHKKTKRTKQADK